MKKMKIVALKKAQVKSGKARYYANFYTGDRFNCVWKVLGKKVFFLKAGKWEPSVYTHSQVLRRFNTKRVTWSFIKDYVYFYRVCD
jgi:hypothetical protein